MMIPHQLHQPIPTSQLFTVRLWQEEIQPGLWEWRGQVQQVQTGETRYFRTRRQLLALLLEMLPPLANNGHVAHGLPPALSSPDNAGRPDHE